MNPEDNHTRGFDPADLQLTVIALPLWERMRNDPNGIQRVVIALHNGYPSAAAATKRVSDILNEVFAEERQAHEGIVKGRPISQYVVARLTPRSIRALAARDRSAKESEGKSPPSIRSGPTSTSTR